MRKQLPEPDILLPAWAVKKKPQGKIFKPDIQLKFLHLDTLFG
jgi:hypothetical protein